MSELLDGLRRGDTEAKRLLFEEYGEAVWRVAFRLSGDGDVADDITQDTFVRAFRSIHSYRGTGSLRGWLCRIALNLYRDAIKLQRRRATLLARSIEAALSSAEVDSRDDADAVTRIVDQLPEKYRVVLVLHDLEGLGHDEIGEALGIASGSSRARLSRARALVREKMIAVSGGKHGA